MKQIASTPLYTITYDEAKNRMHIKLRGSWLKKEDYPNWLDDHEAAVKATSPGFTIVADTSDVKGTLDTGIWTVAQQQSMAAGVRKTALIFREGSIVAKAQAQVSLEDSGLPFRWFSDMAEAEKWLEEP